MFLNQKMPPLPPQRQSGVCLHISSLPGKYGIGEIGSDALDFVATMREMGLGVWQFLPLGPTAYGDSPYQPLSSFAGNENLISIGDLIEEGLLNAEQAIDLSALPRDYVDYGALIPAKSRLLAVAARNFQRVATADRKAAYEAFLERNDSLWLHDYALFRILKSAHGERPWHEWQAEYVHHDETALRRLENEQRERINEIKVQQFLFFEQWQRLRETANAAGIRLFGDMPICLALDSADAWANRDLLRIDKDGNPDFVAGVPPDYFSEDGQLWGNPLYDWAHHEATGYSWWIERLRASAELANIVRIDHFRGFESYWSVPADSETARIGAWEPGPGDAIFDSMRDALGALPIVAEDLGVITPAVEALRDRHQIPGMVVLQFDLCDEAFDLGQVPDNSVCYTGTHDNDTTLGWFRGSPDDIRPADEIEATQNIVLRRTGGSEDSVATDLVRLAFSTEARIAIAPMQDYLGLGSEARINTPGTSSNNWRWRVQREQLSPNVRQNVANLVHSAGRSLPDTGSA